MNNYKNLIFTTHALARLKKRSINQEAIYKTVNLPDNKFKKQANYKFIKTVKGRNIQVISQFKTQQKKWLIISVWVRGEDDQPSLIWQLITLPFKILYKLLAKIAKIILSYNKKSRRHRQ
jgi:hypothetical protein